MESNSVAHSPREGIEVDYQWWWMTILATARKCLRTSFFEDLKGPGIMDRRVITGDAWKEVACKLAITFFFQNSCMGVQSQQMWSMVPLEAWHHQQVSDTM